MSWSPDAPPEKESQEATPKTMREWAHRELSKLDWHKGSDAAFEAQLKSLKTTTNLLTVQALELLLEVLARPDNVLGSPLTVTNVFSKRYTAYKQFVSDTINYRKQQGWL